MECQVIGIIQPDRRTRLSRPLISSYVPAGFPSPAEDYVEGRIDLNHDLIRHPLTAFYIRVVGDSMVPEIHPGSLLIVDRGVQTNSGNIVVARINDELCIKKLLIEKEGRITLLSENPRYRPILITRDGFKYRKAGVIVNGLTPASQLTLRMFDDTQEKFRQVMVAVDEINRRWGPDTVRFAVAKPDGSWRTKFQKRSPRYTTCLQEVMCVE